MQRFLIPLLLLGLLGTGVRAQIGLHPPEVDWQRLQTPTVNVIFPAGYEHRATRVATIIDRLQDDHTQSVGERSYRYDLVLQTPNTTINGYVGLAPFRSEYYLTPPQDYNLLSATIWLDLLTIHEHRHVMQASNERRGLTKVLSWLLGQQAWAGLSNLATPNWFSEGDAVVFETALSRGGRGRTPAFSADLRALLDEEVVYRYGQARNGSFRRLVPDHYRYGYAMTTYAREEFGNDVWKKVLHQGAAYLPMPFYSFSSALRRSTGMGTRKLYRETMRNLRLEQREYRRERGEIVEGEALREGVNWVRNYAFLQITPEGLYAYRRGNKTTPALVRIDPATGAETRVARIGRQREPYVHVRGDYATWMVDRVDARYSNRGYSEVMVLNMKTGEKTQLTEGRVLLSPSLDFAGERLVAVEHLELEGRINLVILDRATGEETRTYPLPPTTLSASYPRFSLRGEAVFFYEQAYAGVAIRRLDLTTGTLATLKPHDFAPLGPLNVTAANRLVFSSGHDGIDNVYFMDPDGDPGRVRQLTNVSVGAYYPTVGTDRSLYYVAPTSRGQRIRRMNVDLNKRLTYPKEWAAQNFRSNFFQRTNAFAAEMTDVTQDLPDTLEQAIVEDVSDKLHGIRIHSWSAIGDVNDPGVALISSNALNTVQVAPTITYNRNEEALSGGLVAAFGGWYPVLTVNATAADRVYSVLEPDLNERGQVTGYLERLNQFRLSLAAQVPLTYITEQSVRRVTPRLGVDRFLVNDATSDALDANFTSVSYGISVSQVRQQARQQVAPRMGVTLSVGQERTIGNDLGSAVTRASGRLFLPGLFLTHSLRLDANGRWEDSGNLYQYTDNFVYPRGYEDDYLFDASYRVGANYQLPVLYPEIGILGIYYLSRLRLNAFYDLGGYRAVQFGDEWQAVNSAGVQLLFDNVWFNTLPASFGLQFAHRLNDHPFNDGAGRTTRFRFVIATDL